MRMGKERSRDKEKSPLAPFIQRAQVLFSFCFCSFIGLFAGELAFLDLFPTFLAFYGLLWPFFLSYTYSFICRTGKGMDGSRGNSCPGKERGDWRKSGWMAARGIRRRTEKKRDLSSDWTGGGNALSFLLFLLLILACSLWICVYEGIFCFFANLWFLGFIHCIYALLCTVETRRVIINIHRCIGPNTSVL